MYKFFNKFLPICLYILFFVGALFIIFWIEKQASNPTNKILESHEETPANPKQLLPVSILTTPSPTPIAYKQFRTEILITDDGFMPKVIHVPYGSQILMKITNRGGYHNITIDDLSVSTPYLATGESFIAKFIASSYGTFKMYSNTSAYYKNLQVYGTIVVE